MCAHLLAAIEFNETLITAICVALSGLAHSAWKILKERRTIAAGENKSALEEYKELLRDTLQRMENMQAERDEEMRENAELKVQVAVLEAVCQRK